jgi:hypothetical protein
VIPYFNEVSARVIGVFQVRVAIFFAFVEGDSLLDSILLILALLLSVIPSAFIIFSASCTFGLIAVLYRALPDFLTRSAHFDINFHATGIAAHSVAHTAAHFPISIILASLPCCSIGFIHP